MSKKKKILIWSFSILTGLVLSIIGFGYWFISMIPKPVVSSEELSKTVPADLAYISSNVIPQRGKILTVVTSTDQMGSSGKSTGYELTELARAYYVFQANGYEVEVASPRGGKPPVVIDKDDMKEFSYAFLNDQDAQYKVNHTLPLNNIDPDEYEAIYFVGGKGAMWDFPQNIHIQEIVREIYEEGKVVGAVCHGPAALVNVKLSDGSFLLENKQVSSFTNEEELLLISDAREIFPFLLQDKLEENGAKFNEGIMYLNQVSTEDNLVTGQNPWSTWAVAESIIKQLGHTPKQREITSEENAVRVLGVYEEQGLKEAKKMVNDLCLEESLAVDRELIAVHSLLAAYQFKLGKFVGLLRLLSFSQRYL